MLVSSDGVKVSAELLRLFVIGYLSCVNCSDFVLEAFHRAAAVARSEGDVSVKTQHLEKILPQLLLDF